MIQLLQYSLRTNSLFTFVIFFGYTIVIVFLMSWFLYYKRDGCRNYLFTYIVAGAIIFQLCSLLSKVPMEMGIALGLFAIFGILRYRTVPIKVRELTYLFLCIGISAKNALAKDYIGIERIIASDVILLAVVTIAELFRSNSNETVKIIVYTNLSLLTEENKEALKRDLEQRFFLNGIQKIQRGKIDELKGTVRLKVTFSNEKQDHFSDGDS